MENIIVIGGGLMGSSAAWQLSQYGEKVLLVEQQSAKYKVGSSFGESRITRSLGPKKDIFSFLQRTTIEETKKLLQFLNGIEKPKKHKMSDVYSTSPVTYIYPRSQEEEIKSFRYKGQKDKYKKAFGDKAFRRFGISVPDSQMVIQEYKKYSGTLNPKALIKKLQLGIKKHGNKIRYNQKAVRVTKKKGFYEVKIKHSQTGKTKKLQAKKVVFAVGPHTVSLLKKTAPYFKKLIHCKKVLLSFYKIDKKRYSTYTAKEKKHLRKSHPIFDQNGKMFFSMIDKKKKKRSPIFKLGGHELRGNIHDLDAVWRSEPRKKELKWNRKAFLKYLRMLEIPIRKKDLVLVKKYYCVYSVARTKIPYVTQVVTKNKDIDKNMVVIGGMSGTGAKGCLAYGLLAADLLVNSGDKDRIYQKTRKALGVERLQKEIRKPFI